MKKRSKPQPRAVEPKRTLQMSTKQFVDLEDVAPLLKFLEDFQAAADPRAQNPSKLISLKVPEPLLAAFRFKAQQEKIPYQTMIKRLMLDWLKTA